MGKENEFVCQRRCRLESFRVIGRKKKPTPSIFAVGFLERDVCSKAAHK